MTARKDWQDNIRMLQINDNDSGFMDVLDVANLEWPEIVGSSQDESINSLVVEEIVEEKFIQIESCVSEDQPVQWLSGNNLDSGFDLTRCTSRFGYCVEVEKERNRKEREMEYRRRHINCVRVKDLCRKEDIWYDKPRWNQPTVAYMDNRDYDMSVETREMSWLKWNRSRRYMRRECYRSEQYSIVVGDDMYVKQVKIQACFPDHVVVDYMSKFNVSQRRAYEEIINVFAIDYVLKRGIAEVKIKDLPVFLSNVWFSNHKNFQWKSKQESQRKKQFIHRAWFSIASNIWFDCFDDGDVDWFSLAVKNLNRKVGKDKVVAQSFMDNIKSFATFLDFTNFSFVADILTSFYKVKDAIVEAINSAMGMVGFAKSVVKNMSTMAKVLAVCIIVGIAGCLVFVTGISVRIVMSLVNLISATYFQKPVRVHESICEFQCAESQMGVAGLVAACFTVVGYYITGDSSTLGVKLNTGRSMGTFADSISEHAMELIDVCARKLGYPNVFGSKGFKEILKCAEDISSLTTRPNIDELVVKSPEVADEVKELHERSRVMRQALITSVRDNKRNYAVLMRDLSKLDTLFDKALSCNDGIHNRKTPLCIMLTGAPKVGKTSMMDYIRTGVYTYLKNYFEDKDDVVMKKKFEFEYSSANVYARNSDQDFWEMYVGQAFCSWNDAFMPIDPAERLKTACEIMSAVESSAYSLDRAFGEKGKSYFTSDFCIVTTNLTQFHDIGLTTPAAFERRLHFPLVVERGEDLKDDGSNLNKAWKMRVLGGKDRKWDGICEYLPRDKYFGVVELIGFMVKEYLDRYNAQPHNSIASKIDFVKMLNMSSVSPGFFHSDNDVGHYAGYSDVVRNNNVDLLFGEAQMFNPFSLFSRSWRKDNKDKTKVRKHMNGQPDFHYSAQGEKLSILNHLEGTSKGFVDDMKTDLSYLQDKKNQFENNHRSNEDLISEFVYEKEELVVDSGDLVLNILHDYLRSEDKLPFSFLEDTWFQYKRFYNISEPNFEAPYSNVQTRLAQLVELLTGQKLNHVAFLEMYNCESYQGIDFASLDPELVQSIGKNIVNFFGNALDLEMGSIFPDILQEDLALILFYVIKTNCLDIEIPIIEVFDTKVSLSLYEIYYQKFLNICVSMAGSTWGNVAFYATLGTLGFSFAFILSKIICTVLGGRDTKLTQSEGEYRPIDELEKILSQSHNKHSDKMIPSRKVWRPVKIVSNDATCQSMEGMFHTRSNQFLSNNRVIYLEDEKGMTVMTGVLFGNNREFLVPGHAHYCNHWTKCTVLSRTGTPETVFSRKELIVSDLVDRDLVRFTIIGIDYPEMKSIVGSFPDSPLLSGKQVMRLLNGLGGDDKVQSTFQLFDKGFLYVDESLTASALAPTGKNFKTTYKGYYVIKDGKGLAGMCASPIVSLDTRHHNQPLLGVHIARLGNDTIVAPVFKSDFKYYTESRIAITQCFDNTKWREGFEGVQGYYVNKNPVHMASETEYEKSPIFDDVPFNDKVAPAVLDQESYMNFLDKYKNFPPRPMPDIVSELLGEPEKLFELFGPPDIDYQYKMLTIEQCLFGDEDLGIDPMDLKTSSGIHHWKGRPLRGDFVRREDGWICPEFKSMVSERIVELIKGVKYSQVVKDALKDELREMDRVNAKKTRVFCVGNLIDFVVTKMVMGHLVQHLKKHRFNHSVAIGTNPHDYDWKFLNDKIFKYGRDNVIGGDMSSQDISTRRWMGTVLLCFLKYYIPKEYSKFENLFRGIVYNIVTTVHVGSVGAYLFPQGNSSGNYLTGFYNSLTTCVYLTASFYFLKPINSTATLKDLSVAVNGDDNLGSVSNNIKDWYNNLTLATSFKELFGVELTNPAKGVITEPFLSESDHVFLARKFEERDGRIFPTLDFESIFGMLCYIRKPKGEDTIESKLIQNCNTAVLELMYHEDSDVYIERIQQALWDAGINTSLRSSEYWNKVRLSQYSDSFIVV